MYKCESFKSSTETGLAELINYFLKLHQYITVVSISHSSARISNSYSDNEYTALLIYKIGD